MANSGGSDGGGGGGGSGGTVCVATFTGAFSATYMPCQVGLGINHPTWDIASGGYALPTTPYLWAGFSLTMQGSPAAGTYDLTASQSGLTNIVQQMNHTAASPGWGAGKNINSGMIVGSLSVTISDLGPSTTDITGAPVYPSPHGSVTATLVQDNAQSSLGDENLSVTF